ncbi:hypothetical protein A6V29_03100 [Blastococcus sp. CCUG 61487]|nr:hypothetical protein A6V29_03100 [Blastococcus sp. CCUG 61487]
MAGIVLAVVAALAGGGAVSGSDDRPTSPWSTPSAGGDGVLVLPVIPVGGDLPDGRQTLAGALADVDRVAAVGAGAVGLTADLRWLCRTTQCRTGPLEPVVSRALELGLRVYMQVNSSPEWMRERGRWYAPVGADVERWADLFAQIVAEFGTDVSGYEVWNEPNIDEFWAQGPDPDEYADLLKAVWTATERVDPAVTLVGGVLSNNDLGYMSRLSAALAERGGNAQNRFFYDVLGVHPYAGERGEGFDPEEPAGTRDVRGEWGVKDMTLRGVERLREQVAEDEGIERDVLIGEFGYSTTRGAWYHVPEPFRAAYLANALRIAVGWEWLQGFTVYLWEDDPDDGFSIVGTPSEQALERAATALQE